MAAPLRVGPCNPDPLTVGQCCSTLEADIGMDGVNIFILATVGDYPAPNMASSVATCTLDAHWSRIVPLLCS